MCVIIIAPSNKIVVSLSLSPLYALRVNRRKKKSEHSQLTSCFDLARLNRDRRLVDDDHDSLKLNFARNGARSKDCARGSNSEGASNVKNCLRERWLNAR